MPDTPLRKTGIVGVSDVPWGTHFSQFYSTAEDIKETFVPYFAAGLKNNEYCLWLTVSPSDIEPAAEDMRRALPDYDQYAAKEQIRIISIDDWYFKDGVFNKDHALISMIRELNEAMVKGYEGMRVAAAGNLPWSKIKEFKQVFNYEASMNEIVHKYRLIVLCSYPLQACEINDAVEVASNHEFVILRKEGRWTVVENSTRKNVYSDIYQLNEKFKSMIENSRDGIFAISPDLHFIYLNQPFELLTGWMRSEWINRPVIALIHPGDQVVAMNMMQQVLKGETPPLSRLRILARSGDYVNVEIKLSPQIQNNMIISVLGIGREVTG